VGAGLCIDPIGTVRAPLQLYRLDNYKIKYIPTNNFGLHLYYCEPKEHTGVAASDRRFFMRAIIRHADLLSKQASLEYFLKEGERQVPTMKEQEPTVHISYKMAL
jgi:hypothetical protein